MSVDYYFYSPKSGELLKIGRYAGMPFLMTEYRDFGVSCAVELDDSYKNIIKWTIDKESAFYKEQDYSELFLYYTKEEILKMQKHMKCNNTLLQELLEKNNLDGLIVRIG